MIRLRPSSASSRPRAARACCRSRPAPTRSKSRRSPGTCSRAADQEASRSPAARNRRKSAGFAVAKGTPARRAIAAIMQSTRDPRRRPPWLNNIAVVPASSPTKGSGSRRRRVASSTWRGSTGPHKNSAQPIELMPSGSSRRSHSRSRRSSVEPRKRARIKKLVSRWITREAIGRAARRRGALGERRVPSSPLPPTRDRESSAARRGPAADHLRQLRLPPPLGWPGATLRISTPSSGARFARGREPCRRRASRSI